MGKVFPKNAIMAVSWDINAHLFKDIYTGYQQKDLFTLGFYWTAQKTYKM